MAILSREDIPEAIRKPYEAKHKRHLREALLAPGLTEPQRNHLRSQIKAVGSKKVYAADSPPKLGAFRAALPRTDTVRRMKKSELVELADRLKLDSEGTKPELLDRILAVIA